MASQDDALEAGQEKTAFSKHDSELKENGTDASMGKPKDALQPASSVWWKLADVEERVFDEHGNDDSDAAFSTEKMPFLIFNPASRFRVIWDIVVLLLLVYFVFAVPFRMCFIDSQFADKTTEDCLKAAGPSRISTTTGLEFCFPVKGCQPVLDVGAHMCSYVLNGIDWVSIIWSTAIDCFFIVDVCINFRTAYKTSSVDEGGDGQTSVLVTDGWLIFKNYFTSWFIIDILGSLPLDLLNVLLVSDGSTDESEESSLSTYALLPKLMRFLKFFRLLKLVRAARIGRIIQKLQDLLSIRPGTVQLCILSFQFGIIAHWMACILFYIGIDNVSFDCQMSRASANICSDDDVLNGRKVSWITETTIVSRNYGETTVADAPYDTQYMVSFYWAVTTMTTVGYGDIKPFTHYEVIACIFFMIIGASAFSYVVGNISTLIGQLGGDSAAYREKMEAVTVFLHDHHVPKDLKTRIRKYYDYAYNNPYVEITAPELAELSSALQLELLKFFRKDVLSTSLLFHGVAGENEKHATLRLLACLKHTQHGPGDYIFFQGEFGRDIFFVFNGEVDVVDPDAREVMVTFRKGGFFGENSLLKDEEQHPFAVKSRGWSEIVALDISDFDSNMADFPQLSSRIRATARVRWRRLEIAINAHKVLRRARQRSSVTGKKLLRIVVRYAEQESLTESLSSDGTPNKRPQSATKQGNAEDQNPGAGEPVKKKPQATMSRDEVEILGDLRSSVFGHAVGQSLARLVFRKGIEKWDWSLDWVDSLSIVHEVQAMAKEFGGIVNADRTHLEGVSRSDLLDVYRNQGRPITQGSGEDMHTSGPMLEQVLQRITFRLDAIDESLESHHLLKEVRLVRNSVEKTKHHYERARHLGYARRSSPDSPLSKTRTDDEPVGVHEAAIRDTPISIIQHSDETQTPLKLQEAEDEDDQGENSADVIARARIRFAAESNTGDANGGAGS